MAQAAPLARSLLGTAYDLEHAKSSTSVGASQDLKTLRLGRQMGLSERTDGLYQADGGRQEEMARALAAERDSAADRAFKEWSRAKVMAAAPCTFDQIASYSVVLKRRIDAARFLLLQSIERTRMRRAGAAKAASDARAKEAAVRARGEAAHRK